MAHPGGGVDSGPGPVLLPRPAPGPGHVAVEASPPGAGACIDAPYLDQREKYPTGCESVCAVMDLQYYGVDLSVEEFIDNYLPLGDAPHVDGQGNYVGCDPREAFPGSPYEESGWGCYSPVIEKALVRALEDTGARTCGGQAGWLHPGGPLWAVCEPGSARAAVGHHRHGRACREPDLHHSGHGGGVRLGVPHALPAVGGGGGGQLAVPRPPGRGGHPLPERPGGAGLPGPGLQAVALVPDG